MNVREDGRVVRALSVYHEMLYILRSKNVCRMGVRTSGTFFGKTLVYDNCSVTLYKM